MSKDPSTPSTPSSSPSSNDSYITTISILIAQVYTTARVFLSDIISPIVLQVADEHALHIVYAHVALWAALALGFCFGGGTLLARYLVGFIMGVFGWWGVGLLMELEGMTKRTVLVLGCIIMGLVGIGLSYPMKRCGCVGTADGGMWESAGTHAGFFPTPR